MLKRTKASSRFSVNREFVLLVVFLTISVQQTERVSVASNTTGWSCCPLLWAETWPGITYAILIHWHNMHHGCMLITALCIGCLFSAILLSLDLGNSAFSALTMIVGWQAGLLVTLKNLCPLIFQYFTAVVSLPLKNSQHHRLSRE